MVVSAVVSQKVSRAMDAVMTIPVLEMVVLLLITLSLVLCGHGLLLRSDSVYV